MFRSPLMKALDRSVEMLGLWIVTSSVTFIKSANQSSIKLCQFDSCYILNTTTLPKKGKASLFWMLSVSKAHINSIQHIIIKEVLRGSLHILAIISVIPYKTDLQSYDSCWELASLIIVLGFQVHFHLSISLLQFIHDQSQYIHNFTFILLRQHSTAAL